MPSLINRYTFIDTKRKRWGNAVFVKRVKSVCFVLLSIVFLSAITAPSVYADSRYIWTDISKTDTAATGFNWTSVATSSSGKYQVALAQWGDIWTSNDYGVSWTDISTTDTATAGNWWATISSSSSGQYLVAGASGGDIWTSSDYGASWTDISTSDTATAGKDWDSIASDSTGQYLTAGTFGDLWTSSDYGASWTDVATVYPLTAQQVWTAVASSSSGQYITALDSSSDIWTGVLTPITNSGNNNSQSTGTTSQSPDTGYGVPANNKPLTLLLITSLVVLGIGLLLSKKGHRPTK